uniref:Uncharacterized protein n=1 Tax=Palpitomonas bilix TaxID=652834 RepID=A0A7S3G0Q2_9EUKA
MGGIEMKRREKTGETSPDVIDVDVDISCLSSIAVCVTQLLAAIPNRSDVVVISCAGVMMSPYRTLPFRASTKNMGKSRSKPEWEKHEQTQAEDTRGEGAKRDEEVIDVEQQMAVNAVGTAFLQLSFLAGCVHDDDVDYTGGVKGRRSDREVSESREGEDMDTLPGRVVLHSVSSCVSFLCKDADSAHLYNCAVPSLSSPSEVYSPSLAYITSKAALVHVLSKLESSLRHHLNEQRQGWSAERQEKCSRYSFSFSHPGVLLDTQLWRYLRWPLSIGPVVFRYLASHFCKSRMVGQCERGARGVMAAVAKELKKQRGDSLNGMRSGSNATREEQRGECKKRKWERVRCIALPFFTDGREGQGRRIDVHCTNESGVADFFRTLLSIGNRQLHDSSSHSSANSYHVAPSESPLYALLTN